MQYFVMWGFVDSTIWRRGHLMDYANPTKTVCGRDTASELYVTHTKSKGGKTSLLYNVKPRDIHEQYLCTPCRRCLYIAESHGIKIPPFPTRENAENLKPFVFNNSNPEDLYSQDIGPVVDLIPSKQDEIAVAILKQINNAAFAVDINPDDVVESIYEHSFHRKII